MQSSHLIAGIVLAGVSAAGVGVVFAGGGESDAAVFVPMVSCRAFDNREAPFTVGDRTTPVSAGETWTIQVVGPGSECDVPTEATAVSLNLAKTEGSHDSHVALWPAGQPQPATSALNWAADGPAVANNLDVMVSSAGEINVYNQAGNARFLGDITGYFIPADTQAGQQGPQGEQGESAYEVAVSNGFVGSESEWLASLVPDQQLGGDGIGYIPLTGDLEGPSESRNIVVPPDFKVGGDMWMVSNVLNHGVPCEALQTEPMPTPMAYREGQGQITDIFMVNPGFGNPWLETDVLYSFEHHWDTSSTNYELLPGDSLQVGAGMGFGYGDCEGSQIEIHSAAIYYETNEL